VFFDETGAKTDMTRRYGWGRRAERVTEPVPHRRWRTATLLHAIDVSGTRAAMITDGPTNAAVFETFVDWLLAPALRDGDLVVMDNLPSHKSPRAVARIEEAGARVVYLPPYSPDLNPIERIFAKIKQSSKTSSARSQRETSEPSTTPSPSRWTRSRLPTAETSSAPAAIERVKNETARTSTGFSAMPNLSRRTSTGSWRDQTTAPRVLKHPRLRIPAIVD